LWLRVTLQFGPGVRKTTGPAQQFDWQSGGSQRAGQNYGSNSQQSTGRPRAAGLILTKRVAGVSTDERFNQQS